MFFLYNAFRHVTTTISIKSLTLEGTHSYYVSSGLEGLLAVTTMSFWDFSSILKVKWTFTDYLLLFTVSKYERKKQVDCYHSTSLFYKQALLLLGQLRWVLCNMKLLKNTLKMFLKLPQNTIKLPWNIHENSLATPLKLTWNTLKTILKHPSNTLEMTLTHYVWNFLETCLKHLLNL